MRLGDSSNMAEFSGGGSDWDEDRPSLFELISEQQLSALLAPSVRYVLVLLTQRHPRYLLRILNSFDELWAAATLILERHYLRKYGGSFTEHFYGLTRERALRLAHDIPRTRNTSAEAVRDATALGSADIWRNLLVLVGIPYVKRKLDEAYDIHAAQSTVLGANFRRDILPPNADWRQRIHWCFKWFLRHVYPSLHALYYAAMLVFQLSYLFGNTQFASPFLWLIRTRIRRLNTADHKAFARAAVDAALNKTASSYPGAPARRSTNILVRSVGSTFSSGLNLLLPASMLTLKFLEWWHASDFSRQLSRKAGDRFDFPAPRSSESALVQSKDPESPAAFVSKDNGEHTESYDASTSPSSKTSPPPISALSLLPILTVAAPTSSTSALCPICRNPIATPTAIQTGYVYCYACIFRWIEGNHEQQAAWMEGRAVAGAVNAWNYTQLPPVAAGSGHGTTATDLPFEKLVSREGLWESGQGRCAVTGRRVLGGTDGLRRIIA